MTDEKGFESANAANYRSALRIVSLCDDRNVGVIRQALLIELANERRRYSRLFRIVDTCTKTFSTTDT